jgi:hypothetical protein
MAEPFPQERLLDLYKIAIEEYRFEVRLGWDRATYLLALNSAILSVATGLLKLENPPIVYVLISCIFVFGLLTSLVGSLSITKAHEYYRRTVVKKTAIEQLLGLNAQLPGMHQSLNLAVGTTKGQSEHMTILDDPEKWVNRPHRRSAITFWLRWILRGMAIVDGIGAAVAVYFLSEKWINTGSIAAEHWLRRLF